MKKRVLFTMSLGLVLVLGLMWTCVSEATAAEQKTIVLKQSVYTPLQHDITRRALEFSKRVAEATAGRVKIEVYPSESLCPAKEDECCPGREHRYNDYRNVVSGWSSADSNFSALPWFLPENPQAAAKALFEIMPIVQKSIDRFNVHLIHIESAPSNYVLVTKKEVRTPAQLKGLKIRTAGGLTDNLAINWGAAIVSIPSAETYTALQRGLVDGTIFSVVSYMSFKLDEVAQYITDFGMGANALLIAINKDKWQQISPADQKAITDLVPTFMQWAIEDYIRGDNKERAKWDSLSLKVYKPTPAESDLWKMGARPLWEKFAAANPDNRQIIDILKKYGASIK